MAVLGAQGFLGENLIHGLRPKYSILGTTRAGKDGATLAATSSDEEIHLIYDQLKPGALVINAIGKLTNSIDELNSDNVSDAMLVNGKFPPRLSRIAFDRGLRFIHISTDAIFSNTVGDVDEKSLTSPQGVYGKSKLLGEVSNSNAVTIRCSFVGPSAGLNKSGLWSWIENLNQGEIISGFKNHLWSGVTTNQLIYLCDLLADNRIFQEVATVSSIHHFCPNPAITKYELVSLIAAQIRPDVIILPINHNIAITRNLLSKFNSLNKLFVNHKVIWKSLIREAALGYKN